MRIRDDRQTKQRGTPAIVALRRSGDLEKFPGYYSPDAVLIDCPECGRAHFVRVGDCPTAAEAAQEVAAVDRKAA